MDNTNKFPRGPINIQTQPIIQSFSSNSQVVLGKRKNFEPTLISVDDRNIIQSNKNINYAQEQEHYFKQTGPISFRINFII